MSRPRHPNKHVEEAVRLAETLGWKVELSNGHAWGKLMCRLHSRDGCTIFIYSTPRKPETHARHVRREVDGCPHTEADEEAQSTEEANE